MDIKAIENALDWLDQQGIRIPLDVADLAVYHGIKTAGYYLGVLYAWVNDLYNHEVTEGQFVDKMADVIEQQLTRAWYEGMRANGLTPDDMDEDLQAQLQDVIANEYSFVDGFAADIASGKFTLAQLQARAGVWANRYNDVVTMAKLATADLKDRFIWIYGDTDHCSTCEALNGIVATAKEWEIAGIRPQNPPNDLLECGGWRCQCRLEPTEQRRSPKALDTLLNIGVR